MLQVQSLKLKNRFFLNFKMMQNNSQNEFSWLTFSFLAQDVKSISTPVQVILQLNLLRMLWI